MLDILMMYGPVAEIHRTPGSDLEEESQLSRQGYREVHL